MGEWGGGGVRVGVGDWGGGGRGWQGFSKNVEGGVGSAWVTLG